MNDRVSFETAKKLADVGIVIESDHCYCNGTHFVAYSIAEMLEMMPDMIRTETRLYEFMITMEKQICFCVSYWDFTKEATLKNFRKLELPEALAEMLIWLKDNNYLNKEK